MECAEPAKYLKYMMTTAMRFGICGNGPLDLVFSGDNVAGEHAVQRTRYSAECDHFLLPRNRWQFKGLLLISHPHPSSRAFKNTQSVTMIAVVKKHSTGQPPISESDARISDIEFALESSGKYSCRRLSLDQGQMTSFKPANPNR
jgi:hypothetical protein